MKISYAITVCNELKEIKNLIQLLILHKRMEDEIVVLFDTMGGTLDVLEYLLDNATTLGVRVKRQAFDGHFGSWKNKFFEYCTGDYIFQLDADEIPTGTLIHNLPFILESNPDADMFLCPRVNTVTGLTDEHIKKWGWRIDEKGWVNYPDFQRRIYKNDGIKLKWINKVHEILVGYSKYIILPQEEEYNLIHAKAIKRQEQQNRYYDTL